MVDQDEEAAFAIPESDHLINQQMRDIREKLLSNKEESKEDTLKELFEISAMLRNIERAGDHVKNREIGSNRLRKAEISGGRSLEGKDLRKKHNGRQAAR